MTTTLINPAGDITSITNEQAAVLAKANPVLGPDAPMAYEGRGDTIQFIYNDDDSDLRLTLHPDGTTYGLQLWEFDEDNTDHSVGAMGEGGDWIDIEGGSRWEDLHVALLGANSAQLEAIDKAVKLKNTPVSSIERSTADNSVLVIWKDADGEEFHLGLDEYGCIGSVGYSILTASDKDCGITEPEWYTCTPLDGPWEELTNAGIRTTS